MNMLSTMTLREQFVEWYLDFVNNFLTLDGFAEYYGISRDQAEQVVKLGKQIHETPHPEE
jgi:hypothetical protein